MLPLSPTGAILSLDQDQLYLFHLEKGEENASESIYLPSFSKKRQNTFSVRAKNPISDKSLESNLKLSTELTKANYQAFQKDFLYFQDKIKRGEIQKAVPISYQKSTSSMDFEASLRKALSIFLKNREGLHYYAFWDFSKKEFIVGLSPEILYEKNEGIIHSIALAGTKHKGKDTKLLNDPKELKEHNWVIKDLKEKLSTFGETKVGPTRTQKAGRLEHLASHLECWPKQKISGIELVNWLHPSPALGVFPSNKSEILYDRYPDEARMYFGSPLCYISENYQKAIVAIRNLQYFNDHIWLFSGCGQVAESELEKEWQELEAKRQSIWERWNEEY